MDTNAFRYCTYGLVILGASQDGKINGMVNNTFIQVTNTPSRVTVALTKSGLTHDMILDMGHFAASILTDAAPFSVFQHFGFQSGRDSRKFENIPHALDAQGMPYLVENVCARFSCAVERSIDLGTHTLFVARVADAAVLSASSAPMSYAVYQTQVKPQSKPQSKGFSCDLCGYVLHADSVPADFVCPICGHDASHFVPLGAGK